MTLLAVVLAASLICSLVPAVLFLRNLSVYRAAPPAAPENDLWRSGVSILIPARNEAGTIEETVRAALRSRGVEHEVIVLDDHSEDDTAAQVRAIAESEPRLRLESAPALPPGWCGKQHACALLARLARHEHLLFIDADVQLTPDAAARAVAFLRSSGAALVSGVPYQRTQTLVESLVIPLIHFLLLGFLPLRRMRNSTHPVYAAGCGQLFLTTRSDYEKAGGHAAIRRSLHDGITLPRAYRAAGLSTDLFDATDVARCRMYGNAAEVWKGLEKNAIEGLAAPRIIVGATLLLALGQIAPMPVLVAMAWSGAGWIPVALAAVAVVLSLVPRAIAARRFRQPTVGVLLHPAGVAVLVAIQWSALGRWAIGWPPNWKQRDYAWSEGTGRPLLLRSERSTGSLSESGHVAAR